MTAPFVKFFMSPTKSISSSAVKIFEAKENTCLIDSVYLSNTTASNIDITVTVAREKIASAEKYFNLATKVNIPPYQKTDILEGKPFVFEAGDCLYAFCNASSGEFDSFVMGQELTEK